jgi:hypothetical protein
MVYTDDTTVVGLITNNDETDSREEVGTLTVWCQINNLSLNVSKTKKADYGLYGIAMGMVKKFKFLGVHISEELKWSNQIVIMVKNVREQLFNLRRL